MGKSITILIIDDDQDILDMISAGLNEIDSDIQVITTNSGYTAMQLIHERDIDLVLTDIAMPDMDGLELYKRLKELRPELQFIMMTGFGYDPNHVIINTKQIGLKQVIYKPFDVNKLHKKIYEVLGIKDSK